MIPHVIEAAVYYSYDVTGLVIKPKLFPQIYPWVSVSSFLQSVKGRELDLLPL